MSMYISYIVVQERISLIMKITSNSHEYSLSIENLDICVLRPTGVTPELTIAFHDDDHDEPIQMVTLTPAQAQALRAHLNSATVQQILSTETSKATI